MKFFGWMSTVALVLCGLPEIYSGLKTGTVGSTQGFLYLWLVGEIAGFIYSISLKKLPLILNYGINTIIVMTIIAIKEGII
jgi:hypothetical protein